MKAQVQIVFYSMYGHVCRMAEAVTEGVRSVPGAEAVLRQVAETLQDEALAAMGAVEARKAFAHVPVADPESLADTRRPSQASTPRCCTTAWSSSAAPTPSLG